MAAIIIFCAELLLCVALGVSVVWALLAGLAIFLIYGRVHGHTWRALGKMALDGVKTAKSVVFVMVLIGVLTALWRACGTLPLIICYAVDLIRPGAIILMSFLLCCGVSVLTGTSFGTAATMGTVCMTVALSMGASPAAAGGAILGGCFFGDRCSPVSTSALLVSELTETSIYDNIRKMLKTGLVPFLISCAVYALFGFFTAGSGQTAELWSVFGAELRLYWPALIPAVLILGLSALRVNVKWAMAASIAAAAVLCFVMQGQTVSQVLQCAVFGYTSSTAAAGALLDGGGIRSMLRVIAIICISSTYSGIFQGTGLLDGLRAQVARLGGRFSPFAAMLLTSAAASMIACNQTLAIMLTHQLCDELETGEGQAIDMEDTVVVVAPLVPWSIASAVPLQTVGAPMTGILFAVFLYALPLCGLIRPLIRGGKRRTRAA